MRPALEVLACLALVSCRAAGPPALTAGTDVDPRLRVLLVEEPHVADVLFGHADEVGTWLGPEVCVQRLDLRHCRLDELLPILAELLFHPEPRRRGPVDVEPVRVPLLRLVGDPSRNRLLLAGEPETVRWVAELLARLDLPPEPVRR